MDIQGLAAGDHPASFRCCGWWFGYCRQPKQLSAALGAAQTAHRRRRWATGGQLAGAWPGSCPAPGFAALRAPLIMASCPSKQRPHISNHPPSPTQLSLILILGPAIVATTVSRSLSSNRPHPLSIGSTQPPAVWHFLPLHSNPSQLPSTQTLAGTAVL